MRRRVHADGATAVTLALPLSIARIPATGHSYQNEAAETVLTWAQLVWENRPMDTGQASTTAMGTALMRAAHARLDRPVLIEDSWGDRLIPAEVREQMLARAGVEDLDAALRAHPSYGTVILRARYAEDALLASVGRGVRQYVIVGAGMDSFALRRPSFAEDVEIFEVDHPSTQAFKTSRLLVCEIAQPRGLHLVAADLSEIGLDQALAGSPLRHDRPSLLLVAWRDGLSRRGRRTSPRSPRSHRALPAGSELVFSYLDQSLLVRRRTQPSPMQRARAQVASLGEP